MVVLCHIFPCLSGQHRHAFNIKVFDRLHIDEEEQNDRISSFASIRRFTIIVLLPFVRREPPTAAAAAKFLQWPTARCFIGIFTQESSPPHLYSVVWFDLKKRKERPRNHEYHELRIIYRTHLNRGLQKCGGNCLIISDLLSIA